MDLEMAGQIAVGVIGGLGIFLLGMKNMSEGMQAVAGNRLRSLISAMTSNRIIACGVGALITMLIQSSSVTTVMVVGMVNAGIMTLVQAIGVILGANIGTTITGWILVLEVGKYGLPLLGVSAFFFLFSKNEKLRYSAMLCLGLGMVFFGLELMKTGFKPLAQSQEFVNAFANFTPDTYWGLMKCCLTGAALTALVQSSSATLGITIGLASTGLISFPTAAALVLGENIGTTITAMLASIGASVTAKRAAFAHLCINIIGVIWITSIFHMYIGVVHKVVGHNPNAEVHKIAVTLSDGTEQTATVTIDEHISLIDRDNSEHIATVTLPNNETYSTAIIFDGDNKQIEVPMTLADGTKQNITIALSKASASYPHISKGIAMTHTGFNVTNAIIFLPLMGLLAKLLERVIPKKAAKEIPHLKHLDIRMLDTPGIGIQQSKRELGNMANRTERMINSLRYALVPDPPDNLAKRQDKIFKNENILDILQKEVFEFLGSLLSGNVPYTIMTEGRKQLRIADEYESIGDYITTILKLKLKMRDADLTITDAGNQELLELHDQITEYLQMINIAVEEDNTDILSKACTKGDTITHFMKDSRSKHLERVEAGIASPLKSLIFTDMLNAYRRIKDHCLNIAEVLAGEK